MRLGNVIEGHHHDAQKHHCGNSTDPVPVRGHDAVLIGVAGPAQQLQRTKVGRNKRQPRHPRSHLPSGQEEVFAGFSESLQIKANPQHQSKIESDNA